MRFGIVLVVHDPGDRFAVPLALPVALASLERLRGDFRVVVVVNSCEDSPTTAALAHRWTSTHEWADLVLLPGVRGAAASFNAALPLLDDVETLVFMSGDAELVDSDVLASFERVLRRWPRVGCVHPLSVFEDAPYANASVEWDSTAYRELADRLAQDADRWRREEDPTTTRARHLAEVCAARPLAVSRPRPVLPLTFLAMRRSLVLGLGGFDERWQAGFENMDLAVRAYRRGSHSVVATNSFVLHRRVLFRMLGSYDAWQSTAAHGPPGESLWLDKWGHEPRRVWDETRFGPVAAAATGFGLRQARRLPGWRAGLRRARAIG